MKPVVKELAAESLPFDVSLPSPSALLESMRAYGYSLPMAIADLIDNSVSAKAKNIWLTFFWNGSKSWISMIDDGEGMSEETLVSAMRLGSMHPHAERQRNDLGRFGLGLKTSSLSQCKRFTVLSKQGGSTSVRRWDLDVIEELAARNIDEWRLLKEASIESREKLVFPVSTDSGTIVLWERLDRIVGDSKVSDDKAKRNFYKHIRTTSDYLSMVFHRYLEGINPSLRIFVNGIDKQHRLLPWDPFIIDHPATEKLPTEEIILNESRMIVSAYVLPHKDKLGTELHSSSSGLKGWNAQQGFYVYRNKRMLVSGSWLGLGKPRAWTQEEHYKLARISIDIPNTLDQEWQIDVKKSLATPPPQICERLTNLASVVRGRAKNVFTHRGRYGPRRPQPEMKRPWLAKVDDGRPIYKIDREHPLIKELVKLYPEIKSQLIALLEIIEETVPVQQIWIDSAEQPDSHYRPFERKTLKQIRAIISMTYEAIRADGRTHHDAVEHLLLCEEFIEYKDIIESLEDR